MVPSATRPEFLHASHKRQRGPKGVNELLPLVPSSRTFFSAFLSGTLLARAPLDSPTIEALYDDLCRSVVVPNEDDIRLLWRRGYYGKGMLSRSEATWKRRVENRIADAEGREKNLTAEEMTAQRRVQRNIAKAVKKAERERERLIAATGGTPTTPGTPATTTDSAELAPEPSTSAQEVEEPPPVDAEAVAAATIAEQAPREPPPPAWHAQGEQMQLQPEETFYLLFAIGVLVLRKSRDGPPLSILATWRMFLQSPMYAPFLLANAPRTDAAELEALRCNRWDSPFLIKYATYHHFRSMGWVIRSGVKFCTDWVVYGPGGPVGGHAEFAVVIMPSYVDPEDERTSPFRTGSTDPDRAEGDAKSSWRWFHTVNRVCSGVKKTLLLLHVVIPPLSELPNEPDWIAKNPAEALSRFEIREVTVRRFLAGRMRD